MVLTIIRSLSYVSNNWPEMAVFYWNKRLFQSQWCWYLTHSRINGEILSVVLNYLHFNLSTIVINILFYKFNFFLVIDMISLYV